MPLSTPSQSGSSTLIQRVHDRDPDAWDDLAELYGPLVYRWTRQCGLQPEDAADVVQEVFQNVAGAIDSFQYDRPGGTFRGWVWTITRNQVRQFFRRQSQRPQAAGGTDAHQRWQELPEFLESEHEPAADRAKHVLVHRALDLVRPEFDPRTWQAFWRLTVENAAAADIGTELGISPGAVRQAKYRVLCRLKEVLT